MSAGWTLVVHSVFMPAAENLSAGFSFADAHGVSELLSHMLHKFIKYL